MFAKCPKCGHSPLPAHQALPAACPACGVILAKVARVQMKAGQTPVPGDGGANQNRANWANDVGPVSRSSLIFQTPGHIDPGAFWSRVALLAAFSIWGLVLIGLDYRTGEIGTAFLHRPLLIFHEAGHVIFRLLGHWMMVLGGTLGQLVMPGILIGALLLKNRDPYGASIGLWFFGVSLLDTAPYMYDALHPQLTLLSGATGEEGGHDWIYLFSSLGLLQKAQMIGGLCHKLGALTVILALGWGARTLVHDHARMVHGMGSQN
jgi:hypothetical protein